MKYKRRLAGVLAAIMVVACALTTQWCDVISASALELFGVKDDDGIEMSDRLSNGFVWGVSEDGSILKIVGEGEMPDFENSDATPWDKQAVTAVIIEGNVSKIGNYAFAECENLMAVAVPDTVHSIGVHAFEKCTALTAFDFSNIRTIGSAAFYESGLESVQLSGSLTQLDTEVFKRCNQLQFFTVADGSQYYADEDGVLFHKDADDVVTLISYPAGKAAVERYEIPEGTAKLVAGALSCANIGTIVFPESMTEIADSSCADNGFSAVEFLGDVTYIGQSSFFGSTNLSEITIPATVEKLWYRAFSLCWALETVVIEAGCTVIDEYVFDGTPALQSITIPASVTQIGGNAFDWTSSELVIKGYTNSAAEAFALAKNITFESIGVLEDEVLYSGNCGIEGQEETVTWEYYNGGKLVISGNGPMQDNPWFDTEGNQVTSIEVDEGVTGIGENAFKDMNAVTAITLPSTLEEIGAYAFWGTQWANPYVPENVVEIGVGAYHIEDKFINSWTVAEGNTAFTVYESGLYNKDMTRLLKWGNKDAVGSDSFNVVLADTLQIIEDYAFRNTGAVQITLPAGLTTIGKEAFYNAWWLKAINIPKGVTSIGDDALDIDGLTRITVEKGNDYFWADERGALFSKDKNVMYYYPRANEARFYQIPEGVKTIKANVMHFDWLEGLLIPNSVKEIESDTILLGNYDQDSNRHILLYGHKNSYAEEYARENQYTVLWGPWGEGSRDYDHEYLVIPVKEYKRLKVACPVDVYVYDADGNEVASVKDERVVTYEETIYAEDMEKIIYLPNGDDYTIEIKATGEGSVSYTIEEVTAGADGEDITNVVAFNNIPIVEEDTLKSDISMLSAESLPVVNKNDGGQIEADVAEIAGDPIEDFVERMYNLIMGRPADSGLDYWVGELKNGTKTGAEVAAGFVLSEEFLVKEITDAEFIQIMYQTFFDRDADEGGLAWWLDAMSNGKSKEEAFAGFVNSEEFGEVCAAYGITQGSVTLPEEPTVSEFVKRLYSEIMGRDADEGGLSYWVGELESQRKSGAEAAAGFILSDEFQEKEMTNAEYIGIMYRTFFGRSADEGGLAWWLNAMENGDSKWKVFAGFANSEEFGELCETYGIIQGSITEPSEEPGPTPTPEPTVSEFVKRLYSEIMGRDADEGGLSYWVGELEGQKQTGAQAAGGFILSEEFQGKEMTNTEYIQIMYKTFFGREADEDGLAWWLGEMESGKSKFLVFAGFANSNEFGELCAVYGITQGAVSGE